MRGMVIAWARHAAGAVAAAVTSVVGGQAFLDFSEVPVSEVGEGTEALILAFALGVYAFVEKALKPLAERFFGSAGR